MEKAFIDLNAIERALAGFRHAMTARSMINFLLNSHMCQCSDQQMLEHLDHAGMSPTYHTVISFLTSLYVLTRKDRTIKMTMEYVDAVAAQRQAKDVESYKYLKENPDVLLHLDSMKPAEPQWNMAKRIVHAMAAQGGGSVIREEIAAEVDRGFPQKLTKAAYEFTDAVNILIGMGVIESLGSNKRSLAFTYQWKRKAGLPLNKEEAIRCEREKRIEQLQNMVVEKELVRDIGSNLEKIMHILRSDPSEMGIFVVSEIVYHLWRAGRTGITVDAMAGILNEKMPRALTTHIVDVFTELETVGFIDTVHEDGKLRSGILTTTKFREINREFALSSMLDRFKEEQGRGLTEIPTINMAYVKICQGGETDASVDQTILSFLDVDDVNPMSLEEMDDILATHGCNFTPEQIAAAANKLTEANVLDFVEVLTLKMYYVSPKWNIILNAMNQHLQFEGKNAQSRREFAKLCLELDTSDPQRMGPVQTVMKLMFSDLTVGRHFSEIDAALSSPSNIATRVLVQELMYLGILSKHDIDDKHRVTDGWLVTLAVFKEVDGILNEDAKKVTASEKSFTDSPKKLKVEKPILFVKAIVTIGKNEKTSIAIPLAEVDKFVRSVSEYLAADLSFFDDAITIQGQKFTRQELIFALNEIKKLDM